MDKKPLGLLLLVLLLIAGYFLTGGHKTLPELDISIHLNLKVNSASDERTES